MVSLVLDTNKAAGGPVLVTSSPFALKSRYNGPAIRLTNAYNGTLYSFGLSGSGEATIDWGDGTRLQTVTLYPLDEYGYMPQNGKVSHTYSNNNERTIVITGADITGIQSDGSFGEYNNGTVLDVSGMTSLQHISCIGNNFTSLDVSGLDELRYLNCSYNYSLNSLNLDGCVALNTLWCNNNTALESLDVTHCPELKTLDCSHSALTSLKVAGLEKLESLSCHWNALTSLDVRVLPSLQKLEADYNQLEAAVVGEIIADLPDRTGFDEGVFKVNSFNGDIENPWSPITTADKAAASAKGWRAE
jgi:Leucine-rich repeat (LRR) protein